MEIKFSLSHKLSKELQREAQAAHMDVEDYITDILIDRHKVKIIQQITKMDDLIEKVDQLIANNQTKPQPTTSVPVLDKPLLGVFSPRVYNALHLNGVTTLHALLNLRYSDLVKLPRVGPATVREVDAYMKENGYSFRGL